MKNLMKRKVVLGVLMTLVLGFGVQGVADAFTFRDSKSGDHAVVSINQPFTISFSLVGLRSQASIRDADNRLTAEDETTFIDSSGYPGTYVDHDSDSDTPARFERTSGETPISPSTRYHYNDEAIGISVSPATLTLRKSGTVIPPIDSTVLSDVPTDTTASLYEGAENSNRRLSSSVSLTGVATVAGVYTITIADITHAGDFPTAPTTRASTIFTIYVWQNTADSRGSTISTGLLNGIAPEFGTVPLSVTLTGDNSTFARVEFEVTRGPGRLYEDKDRDGKADKTASTKLMTFTNNGGEVSRADVVLIPKRFFMW